MDTIHEQVAELQQKIDFLIDQMVLLTGDSQPTQASARRSPLSRKSPALPETDRTRTPGKEVGLNRFRALQNAA